MQLITAEELASPAVNEKAMVTYLTQFYKANLRQGAPIWDQASVLAAAGTGIIVCQVYKLPSDS